MGVGLGVLVGQWRGGRAHLASWAIAAVVWPSKATRNEPWRTLPRTVRSMASDAPVPVRSFSIASNVISGRSPSAGAKVMSQYAVSFVASVTTLVTATTLPAPTLGMASSTVFMEP